MRIFMSRGDYDRAVAGLNDDQRRRFDRLVEVYPAEAPPEPFTVDQDRIAARYAALQDLPAPEHPAETWVNERMADRHAAWSIPHGVWHWPKGNGKASHTDWVHAAWPADPPTWAELADLEAESSTDDVERADRYFLNNLVVDPGAGHGIITTAPQPTAPADRVDLDQILEFMRRWAENPWYKRPARRIKAGETAIAVFAAAGRRHSRGWPKDTTGAAGALADLTGIPVVPDPDLPPETWQLVDTTGEVLYDGTVAEYTEAIREVIREYAAKLADEAGLPRDLFY